MTWTLHNPKLIAGLVLGYLVMQVFGMAIAGTQLQAVTYAFDIVSPLLAVIACVLRARREGGQGMRMGWALVAVGCTIWAIGMMLSAWQDLTAQVASTVTYSSDFFYFFYGVPILLAILSATNDHSTALFSWLDGVQITLAAYLTYLAIFSTAPFMQQTTDAMSVKLLAYTYDVENVVVAVCATLRLIAHRADGGAGRYYRALTLFLWVYAGCAGLYNNFAMIDPNNMGLLELLPVFPFLLLAAFAVSPVPQRDEEGHGVDKGTGKGAHDQDGLALLIDNFTPIFFTASLLGLGLLVMKLHPVPALVSVFVALAVYALRSAMLQSRYIRSERSLREARDHLEQLSLQDGLTGIANRRHFDRLLDAEWQRASRNKGMLSLLMIDIDHFKSLNDHFGHQYGDACLIKIAQALRSALTRSSDVVARYGGEEFAAILPATDLAGAEMVATKMREAVAALEIPNAPARGGSVTVSIGLAVCVAHPQHLPATLIAKADQLLYRAKQKGRNRVESGVLQAT